MLKIKKKTLHTIHVGIWQSSKQLEVVWLDHQSQPHFLFIDRQNITSIPQQITRLQPNSPTAFNFKFITAISPHKIWYKSLVLPQQLNPYECEQQCCFILQSELPIPLEELWFDYCFTPLKQGFRLDIFAIMQTTAKIYLNTLALLQIDVLDNAAHCLLRAFSYFLSTPPQNSPLFLYQDDENCIAVRNKPHQLQLIQQTRSNLTALLTQYCECYDENPENIIVYSTIESENHFPNHWQIVNTDLPLIALGAALWQQDLAQDEKTT